MDTTVFLGCLPKQQVISKERQGFCCSLKFEINYLTLPTWCLNHGINYYKPEVPSEYLHFFLSDVYISAVPTRLRVSSTFLQIWSSIWGTGLLWNLFIGLNNTLIKLHPVAQWSGDIKSKWSIPPFHKKVLGRALSTRQSFNVWRWWA